jgi:hypothetical protein
MEFELKHLDLTVFETGKLWLKAIASEGSKTKHKKRILEAVLHFF